MKLLPLDELETLLKSDDPADIRSGLISCVNTKHSLDHKVIPFEWILPLVDSSFPGLSKIAIVSLVGKEVPVKETKKWFKTYNPRMMQAALSALSGRKDAPVWLLEEGLSSRYHEVSKFAEYAVIGMELPYSVIGEWSKQRKLPFRIAAAKACYGRKDIPTDVFESLVYNAHPDVRKAAAPLARP